MTELELLQMRYAMNEDTIAELNAENAQIKARIVEIIEEEVVEDNPYWTATDDLMGRDFKPALEHRERLMAGDRAGRMYAQHLKEFNTKYVVPLADDLSDVPESYMDLYVKEQTEHFGLGVIGGLKRYGYILDDINIEGGELEGYAMPWAGNAGPVVARQRVEAYWTQPDIIEIIDAAADRTCAKLDWEYQWSVMTGKTGEFMAKYPYYEPAE
jgi:hypothetical protein